MNYIIIGAWLAYFFKFILFKTALIVTGVAAAYIYWVYSQAKNAIDTTTGTTTSITA